MIHALVTELYFNACKKRMTYLLLVLIPEVDKHGLLLSLSLMYCHKFFFLLLIFFSNYCYSLLSHFFFTAPSFVLVLLSSCAFPAWLLSPDSYFSQLFLLLHPVSSCFQVICFPAVCRRQMAYPLC